jgi:DNA sulfur modification protein DndD
MGGAAGADAAKLEAERARIENEQHEAEEALAENVRSLGFALGISRLGPAIVNRLNAEELRESWESLKRGTIEEIKAKMERLEHLPQATKNIRDQLDKLNTENQEISRKLGLMEAEIRKLKADLHTLNEEIGRIQEELSRLGPEQKRIAVAERVGRAVDDLIEQLKPSTTARLEQNVSKHFLSIADQRFQGGRIVLPAGSPPEFEWPDGGRQVLETISGFEKRSFGIAFSLALAEITRRRIPLVIDTPLGNADSEYRPRTLTTMTGFDLDQIIILSHDEEVIPRLVKLIENSISQTFLVEFQGREKGSIVYPSRYFNG